MGIQAIERDSQETMFCAYHDESTPVNRNATILRFDAVSHASGETTVVRELSFDIRAGEVLCLLGPSGCGKTTALRLAAGLEEPRAGRIELDGQEVGVPGHAVPPEARGVGLVFQDYALFPHLSVADNVGFGLTKISRQERAHRVIECLDLVGMAEYVDSFPHMLSGGQQQRVALARALAPDPELILLDEPFSGLDARLRDDVRDRTLHVLKRTGKAALMVTHDAEEAMFLADRIAVMRAGKLVQIGTPEELYCHPVDAFVASFFGEVNRINGLVQGGLVETPFGALPAPGLADGTRADIVIRPEALHLDEAPTVEKGLGTARVLASRLLGRTTLVHLCTCETLGEEIHLHARVPGRYAVEENARRRVHIDRSQAFVFAPEAAT